LGSKTANHIKGLLKKKRISVLSDVQVTQMNGETKLESIHFRDKINQSKTRILTSDGVTEYFI
jgi:translation initiation factor IF-1